MHLALRYRILTLRNYDKSAHRLMMSNGIISFEHYVLATAMCPQRHVC